MIINIMNDYIGGRVRPKTSWFSLLLVIIALVGFGGYIAYIGRGIDIEYDRMSVLSAKTEAASMAKVDLPDNETSLHIPSWSVVTLDHDWKYVSGTSPLDSSYAPRDLVIVDLLHGYISASIRLD